MAPFCLKEKEILTLSNYLPTGITCKKICKMQKYI